MSRIARPDRDPVATRREPDQRDDTPGNTQSGPVAAGGGSHRMPRHEPASDYVRRAVREPGRVSLADRSQAHNRGLRRRLVR